MGCLKLSYYEQTELKIISSKKVLTLNKSENNNRSSYLFGFNGKEMDNEVSGTGNQYDYGFRIYNPRLGRFLSVDPLTKKFPMLTPYQFASNNPIIFVDPDGRIIKLAAGLTTKQKLQIVGTLQKLTNDRLVYKTLEDGSVRIKVASLAKSGTETKVAGTNLLRSLNSSDKTVTIGLGGGGNSAKATNWTNAQNGTGSDATVNFDPTSNPAIKTVDPKTGDVSPQKGRPNEIGLGHELIHTDHIMEGSVDFTKTSHTYQTAGGNVTQTVPTEELRTVGLKGVQKGDITENQLRQENGENKRGAY